MHRLSRSLPTRIFGPLGCLRQGWPSAGGQIFKSAGRGRILCYASDCVDRLKRIKALNRAFKNARLSRLRVQSWRKQLISAIDARIANLLSIGRKAGNIISGTDTLLRKSRLVRLLIIAVDTADDARQKLSRSVFDDSCAVVHYGEQSGWGIPSKKKNGWPLASVMSLWPAEFWKRLNAAVGFWLRLRRKCR